MIQPTSEISDNDSPEIQPLPAELDQLTAASAIGIMPSWFNFVSDAIIVTDASQHILHWNNAATALYGLAIVEVIGQPIQAVIPAVRYLDSISNTASVWQNLQQKGAWRGMFVQHRRDGSEVVIEGSVHVIRDDQGAILGYVTLNRDMTEQHQMASHLRESERRYHTLFTTMAQGVVYQAADGQITSCNPAAERILGLSLAQMQGRSSMDPRWHAIHQDGSPFPGETHPAMIALQTGQEVHNVVMGVYNPELDGYRWLAVNAVPEIPPGAASAISVYATFDDITARIHAEHTLQSNEERLRAILEHGPECIVLIAADNTISYVSPTIIDLLGYSPEVFTSLRSQGVTHPEDMQHVAAFIQAVTESSGVVKRVTSRMRHQDGRWFWMEQRGINQLQNPAVASIIVSFHDVTDRVQAEQAMQRTADRLTTLHAIDRAILEMHTSATIAHAAMARVCELIPNTQANVALYDTDGFLTQLLTANDEPIYGMGPDWHEHLVRVPSGGLQIGEPWVDNNVNLDSYDEPVARLLKANTIRSFLCIPLLVQWQLLGTLNLASTVLDAFSSEDIVIAQEIGNTLAIALHNTTLVESLQQELAARERAEAALVAEHRLVIRLKNEFMATMSHELRTPLNVVLGHSELLLEESYGLLNERQKAALQRIDESGQNLLTLINDILDYAKFEAGQMSLDIMPIEVESLCRGAVQHIAEIARKKQIFITTTLDSAVPSIHADGQRMRQLLVNLLSNAVKFTPIGGEVGLEVRGHVETSRVSITVTDTGIGIAEQDMPRLFQSFTQLDGALSRQYEGTGLGLALVRRLAEAHGGSIVVESTVGVGSRFSVMLPWSPEMMPASVAAHIAARRTHAMDVLQQHSIVNMSRQPPLVLLIEDHESNITVVHDMLTTHGYRFIAARDGLGGLTIARDQLPALILMDIQLPTMSGIDVIQAIRADDQLRAIPVIALTALVMPGDRERCLAAGANEYLAKPVSVHELLETMGRLLAQR